MVLWYPQECASHRFIRFSIIIIFLTCLNSSVLFFHFYFLNDKFPNALGIILLIIIYTHNPYTGFVQRTSIMRNGRLFWRIKSDTSDVTKRWRLHGDVFGDGRHSFEMALNLTVRLVRRRHVNSKRTREILCKDLQVKKGSCKFRSPGK